MTDLLVFIGAEQIGTVSTDRTGRLSFRYEAGWLASPGHHALSLAMPLADVAYPHRTVHAYLWNLLPENPAVLRRWGRQYQVSPNNPAKLLAHVGADVPGAAQFVSPERLEEFQTERAPVIHWMIGDELASRLRELSQDVAAMRRPGDPGKMSLPGAQAKTAFCRDERRNRWGVPSGRAPTTHIIKPCIPGFDGLVENEHLCQDIAARLGLLAARSRVLALDQTYIVVERYDRLPPRDGAPYHRRVHQEDLCQALGIMPGRKYQEEGGPGIRQAVQLIRRASAEPEADVDRFLQANVLNWLIGGTDAHAKNYSFLIGTGDEVRLAPLYDVSSQLPYPGLIRQRVSMKIGEHYDIGLINGDDWRALAQRCALEEERVLHLVTRLAAAFPDEVVAARDQALRDGLAENVIVPLCGQLLTHCAERLESLALPRSRRKRLPSRTTR